MPGFNVSVQQYTPLIRYAPSGEWRPGSPADGQFSRYNDGFRLTTANGSTATFDFNGTGVWIYGAYRRNHGNFSVTLDGIPQGLFNGSASDQFQVVLFGAGGLENRQHSIELTNIPISTNNPYVDIDFITYEMQLDEQSIANPVRVGVSSSNWTSNNLWDLENDSTQGALLTSTTVGAKTTLTFHGEAVEIYGSTGPLNSQFDVSIDGGANTTLDSYYDETRASVLLWSANSLGDVPHTLEVTNQPKSTSQNKLVLHHALVRSATKETTSIGVGVPSATMPVGPARSVPPEENTAFNRNSGAIIGGVIAAVVFLVIVAAATLHWLRKKRRLEHPEIPYVPSMSSSRNILPTTTPSAGSGLQNRQPKYGAPIRASATNPVAFSNIPPKRAPIIDNPFASNDSDVSTNLAAGSQLSASTAASSNLVSSYSSDPRAVYQPREPSAQPLSHLPVTFELVTQPLIPAQSSPPTKPRQSLPPPIQTLTTVQTHSADGPTTTSTQTSFSTGSSGMQRSNAYQPHPQSIFGDLDDTPERPESQDRIMSPPPDYWSSASGQGAR